MERLAKCSNAYSLNWYNIKGNGSNVSQNAKKTRQEHLKKEK
jgi:hypothetical protein